MYIIGDSTIHNNILVDVVVKYNHVRRFFRYNIPNNNIKTTVKTIYINYNINLLATAGIIAFSVYGMTSGFANSYKYTQKMNYYYFYTYNIAIFEK